jgi:hypothetical protein
MNKNNTPPFLTYALTTLQEIKNELDKMNEIYNFIPSYPDDVEINTWLDSKYAHIDDAAEHLRLVIDAITKVKEADEELKQLESKGK